MFPVDSHFTFGSFFGAALFGLFVSMLFFTFVFNVPLSLMNPLIRSRVVRMLGWGLSWAVAAITALHLRLSQNLWESMIRARKGLEGAASSAPTTR